MDNSLLGEVDSIDTLLEPIAITSKKVATSSNALDTIHDDEYNDDILSESSYDPQNTSIGEYSDDLQRSTIINMMKKVCNSESDS